MNTRSRTGLAALVVSAALFLVAGCATTSGSGAFTLSTTAVHGPPETGFDSGLVSVGRLDPMYGAAPGGPANHRSFPFAWKNLPKGTKALAIVMDDPDARLVLAAFGRHGDSFLHWLATDIDPSLGGLPDDATETMALTLGTNGSGSAVYTAPTPPPDIPKDTNKVRIHVYRLRVYALSAPTGLPAGFTLDQLMRAIKTTTLGMAQLNVSYSNQ